MKNKNFHKDFQLNGKLFSSVEELLFFSKNLSDSTQQFLHNWFSDDDFLIVQTSGSTGKPKSIRINKECMINSALATGTFFSLPEKTSALLCLSTHYIAGKMMLVRALVLGWELDIVSPNSQPLRGIKKVYDFTAMVPLQLYNSLDNLECVKKLIVGGGVVSNQLQKKIQAVSTQIFATYGMTETVTHIAVKKLNHVLLHRMEQSYYQLLPDIKISQDDRKCLVIDAPKVASKVIVTNDVVKIISEKKFEWLGRFDNVINSGGVKLHPEQIEKKLSKIIKQRFFVAGVFDETLGEKLILLVESDKLPNLKAKISSLTLISKFEIPKDIYFVNTFVETETKKIQRIKTLDLLGL